MSSKKWTRCDIIKLIHLYRNKEALWNVYNKSYKRQDIKKLNWEELAQEFNVSEDILKKKMKSLRSVYVSERNKSDYSKLSGDPEIYESNLFYFNELKFLDSSITLRKKWSNIKIEDIDHRTDETQSHNYFSDEEIIIQNEEEESIRSSSSIRSHHETKRQRLNEDLLSSEDTLMQDGIEDLFDAFTKGLALQLRKLPLVQARKAMQEMQATITDHATEANLARRLIPLLDRVLIQKAEATTTSKGGIVIPEKAQAKVLKGTVVAVGPGSRNNNGEHVPLAVKTGDVVLLPEYGGTKVELEDKNVYHLFRESDILAKVE